LFLDIHSREVIGSVFIGVKSLGIKIKPLAQFQNLFLNFYFKLFLTAYHFITLQKTDATIEQRLAKN
jgi:hypothetical protein